MRGIMDPISAAPSMHHILDFTETLITRNMEEKDRRAYFLELYPDQIDTQEELKAKFSPRAQANSVNAFKAALGK